MSDRLAILIDGEFMKIRLVHRLERFPDAGDVMDELNRINEGIRGCPPRHPPQLYRTFFYTAEPFAGEQTNPLSGGIIKFAETKAYRQNHKLIADLERQSHLAVRRGELAFRGWTFRRGVAARLMKRTGSSSPVEASDLRANLAQKGVDMRIGLDIASLALKRLVTDIAVVTGDSDMVPALKLARREGLRVYLDRMGLGGCEQLCIHSDHVIG